MQAAFLLMYQFEEKLTATLTDKEDEVLNTKIEAIFEYVYTDLFISLLLLHNLSPFKPIGMIFYHYYTS